MSLLEARHYGKVNSVDAAVVVVEDLPSMPSRALNFTNSTLIPIVPSGDMDCGLRVWRRLPVMACA
jgi:hypothetical protein